MQSYSLTRDLAQQPGQARQPANQPLLYQQPTSTPSLVAISDREGTPQND